MYKLDVFQERFGQLDAFGWWDIEIIQNDTSTQFTSRKFQEGVSVRGVRLALSARDHQ